MISIFNNSFIDSFIFDDTILIIIKILFPLFWFAIILLLMQS